MTKITCNNCGNSTANLNTISYGKKFIVENSEGSCQAYQEKIFTCEICGNIQIATIKNGSAYRKK